MTSSMTISAFALRTALTGLDAMRPEVYADGRNWRRFSVSVGRLAEDERPLGVPVPGVVPEGRQVLEAGAELLKSAGFKPE